MMKIFFNKHVLIVLSLSLLLKIVDANPQPLISNLNAVFKNGQVFLTWQKVSDPNAYYKVYKSSSPIENATQLLQCEYLGWVNSSSSKDFNLSAHDGVDEYLVLDSGSAPLSGSSGLFVATTFSAGNFYYAITTSLDGFENTSIVAGENSMINPVSESVMETRPVFQQFKVVGVDTVLIYTDFMSMKYAENSPLMNSAGFIANDFAVFLNHASGLQPVRIRFHAGGSDFIANCNIALDSEIVISPEDYLPNGDNLSWWGANESYDVYDSLANNTPPVSGINYNYGQQRTTHIIDWAVHHLPVDSNRVYLDGSSFGSIGAYFYAMTFPEKIAAVKLTVGCFNFAFEHDSDPICTLNEGNGNRKDGDDRFGTVNTNLISNLGFPTYNLLNGGWVSHAFNEKSYPVFYAVNGKFDTIMGWTEKTIYYDSVNANHLGGYYFWDSRNHGGIGATWNDDNFDFFRYRRNLSYPAFANCSVNENFGNGDASDGASFGTVNGFLDWKNEVTDQHAYWAATIFLRNLDKADGSIYEAPEVCTADVTPRRLQNFQAGIGDSLYWDVKHLNQIIQSGKMLYEGGVITVPQIKVFKDSVLFELTDETTVGIAVIPSGESTELSIFPNPVGSEAIIHWNQSHANQSTIKIFDEQGNLIRTLLNQEVTQGLHQETWNLTNDFGAMVAPGIYFLQLQSDDQLAVAKVSVIK